MQIRFLSRDDKLDWVCIQHFLVWNPIENPKQGKSIVKLFNRAPSLSTIFKPLIKILLDQTKYLNKGLQNHLETLSQPLHNQEQDQKQDQEQDVVGEPSINDGSPSSNSKIPLLIHKKSGADSDLDKEIIYIPLKNNDVFKWEKRISIYGKKLIQRSMFYKSSIKYKLGTKLIQMHVKHNLRSYATLTLGFVEVIS